MSKLIFSHCTCEDLQFTHCIRLRVDKTENLWYCHKKATLMTFSDKILRTWLIVLPTKMEALRKSLDCHSPCFFHSVWNSLKKVSNDIFNAKIQTFEKGAKIQKLKWDLMKLSKVLRVFLAGKFKSFNETFFEIFKLCVSLSIPILEEA